MDRKRIYIGLTSIVLLAYFVLVPHSAAAGTTITVDAYMDDTELNGNCTLREAVIAANTDAPMDNCPAGSGWDVIVLPAGPYRLSIPGTDDSGYLGDLDIDGNLYIQGAGARETVIDGGGIDRVLHILPLAEGVRGVHIHGVTIRNGDDWSEFGGNGIYNQGSLILVDVWVQENGGYYGGPGGGIYNDGILVLVESVVEGNRTVYGGGGIFNAGQTHLEASKILNNRARDDGGGGIYNSGELVISSSEVANCYAEWSAGGGIYNAGTASVFSSVFRENYARYHGAAVYNTGTMTLSYTTVTENFEAHGSGIFNDGSNLRIESSAITRNDGSGTGGIVSISGFLYLGNTTISGNSGRGTPAGVQVGSGATAYLVHVTIADNNTIINDPPAPFTTGGLRAAGTVRVRNSIIADNHVIGEYPDIEYPSPDCTSEPGKIISEDNNLVGVAEGCNWTPAPQDLLGTLIDPIDPRLSPLADYGGSTQTHDLEPGSPAIDYIGNIAVCLDDDQRGIPRPQGEACDIGAYEAMQSEVSIDIDPKRINNPINISWGSRVAVVIFSRAWFDAPTAIDMASLTFGRTGDEASLYIVPRSGKPACSAYDANNDGYLDLICHFEIPLAGFQCGDTLGILKGELTTEYAGFITGVDSVTVMPCE